MTKYEFMKLLWQTGQTWVLPSKFASCLVWSTNSSLHFFWRKINLSALCGRCLDLSWLTMFLALENTCLRGEESSVWRLLVVMFIKRAEQLYFPYLTSPGLLPWGWEASVEHIGQFIFQCKFVVCSMEGQSPIILFLLVATSIYLSIYLSR